MTLTFASSHRFLPLLFGTVLAVFACTRDETVTPAAPRPGPNYTPLTVGSYWVYEVWASNPTSAAAT